MCYCCFIKAQTDTTFVTLKTTQTVEGAKTFSPAVTPAANVGYGVVVNPVFTATANGNSLSALYVPAPTVANSGTYPSAAVYSGLFGGALRAGILQGPLRTNAITRDNGTAVMTILKPSANIAHLLTFDGRTDTNSMKLNTQILSSTYFRDSLTFRSNAHPAGYSQVLFQPAINQTGYTGITRGLYVNPALTAVTDFRGIETNISAANSWSYYGAGSAPSLFTGRIYIGDTTASNSRLVVNTVRAGNETGQIGVGKSAAAGAVSYINSEGNPFGFVGYRRSSAIGDFVVGSAGGSGTLSFATAGGDKVTILSNGNVGIGTNTPQSTLAVNGEIFAKRVKVTATGWPDYVFEPSYQLPLLAGVEAFIQKNKHLPGIPSAAEVDLKGIDVGDNQAALLKKIEELTLYIIEQNKKAEAQQRQIDVERTRNNDLENRLADIEKILKGK